MVDIERIAVLGAGDMGHGVAELAAINGFEVTLRDIEEDIVEEALGKIEWSLGKLVEKQQLTEAQAKQAFARLTGTTELPEAVGEADLVLEAVPENMELKQHVFAEVETHAPEDAIFASNTSTMRITEIGEKLADPSRLVGMHFFNPVLLMDLIEIVRGEHTSTRALETAAAVADQLGRTTVTVEDSPGFVTSRLIGLWVGAGVLAMEEGLGTKEQIDAAMKFKAGFPMGPFELADYTGLDIGVHASTYIAERLGPAYRAAPSMERLVQQGDLGKKTGQGFYTWEDNRVATQLTPEMAGDFDPGLVLALVANEAAKLVREGVASPEEVDLAMRNGCAFPKGPLAWADERGLDEVLGLLEQLQEDVDTPLADPDPALIERVEQGALGKATGRGFHEYTDASHGAGELETVRIEVDEEARIGTITLDRPHRLNAINGQLIQDLEAALNRLERDEHVRVIVLEGAGDKAFCVGADLQDLGEFTPELASRLARDGHRMCMRMEKLETPVVAAVDGYAFGGGLELTLPADFRLASQRAQFQLPEVTIGLLPAMGGTFRLAKLIGLSHAKEIAMLGERISAERAHEMGLVHRVFENTEFDEGVRAFAEQLASLAPVALRFTKQLTNEGITATPSQAMEAEAAAFGVLASTEDVIEGVSAMFAKKKPDFQGK